MILFSTGWDLLSVVQRLSLARYCNRGFGWLFMLVPLSWNCWEWLTLCWLRSLEFLWRGCHTRGLQGYRSLSRLLAVEWLSAPAEMSAVSVFSHLLSSLYRITHLLVLSLLWTMSVSCHRGVALLWLSHLSPIARASWRWVHIRRPNILWAGEVLSPSVGVFLQLSRERK